jgi:hypothetical protein
VFKIHTRDGETEIIDPKNEEGVKGFFERFKNLNYQKNITGFSLLKTCNSKYKCPTCRRSELKCNNCGAEFEHRCATKIPSSVSRPNGRKVLFVPELILPDIESGNKGGEKITIFVDGSKISLMSHNNQPALRVTLSKPGVIRHANF